MDGEAAGWLQLVTLYPGVGYINQLYVLQSYRRQHPGTTLVQRAHLQELGLKHMVSIPSEMAMPLYRQLGYRPLVYFLRFDPGSMNRQTNTPQLRRICLSDVLD